MNNSKWKDWRLNALNELQDTDKPFKSKYAEVEKEGNHYIVFNNVTGIPLYDEEDPNNQKIEEFDRLVDANDAALLLHQHYSGNAKMAGWDRVEESFHRLNKEAKLVVSLREMRKRLVEIETLFNKTIESGKVDETTVNNWTNTYKSLKQLDERLHKLMECMYKK